MISQLVQLFPSRSARPPSESPSGRRERVKILSVVEGKSRNSFDSWLRLIPRCFSHLMVCSSCFFQRDTKNQAQRTAKRTSGARPREALQGDPRSCKGPRPKFRTWTICAGRKSRRIFKRANLRNLQFNRRIGADRPLCQQDKAGPVGTNHLSSFGSQGRDSAR